jgi:hypothetical protein
VVAYDAKTKNYDFSTYLASGVRGVYELTSTADGWQWYVPFPDGKICDTTKLTTDTWFEIERCRKTVERPGGSFRDEFEASSIKKTCAEKLDGAGLAESVG